MSLFTGSTSRPTWFSSYIPQKILLRVDWIIPTIIHILLIFAILWILISLLFYGVKTKKWTRSKRTKTDQMNVGIIYSAVVVCAVASLLYTATSMVYNNVGFQDQLSGLCDSMADIVVVLYGFVLFSVGAFLWFRQRVFYNNFLLNANYNKIIRVFSSSSIIFIFGGGIGALVINTLPDDHIGSADGCLYQPDDSLRVMYWISFISVLVFGQATLLGLFIYALKQSNDSGLTVNSLAKEKSNVPPQCNSNHDDVNNTSHHNCSQTNFESSNAQVYNQTKTVNQIMKKTFIFALLSTFLDIFGQIFIHYITDPDGNRRTSIAVGSVNAFLNLLFLVLSLVKYKEILTSLCCSLSPSRPNADLESRI